MSLSHYTILVAYDISLVGTGNINNDYSVLTGGTPIQQVGMVE